MKWRVFFQFAFFEVCLCLPTMIGDFDIWEEEKSLHNNFTLEGFNNSRQARVLNFFPVPVEEECRANDGRRSGVCMNTYECRMQGGTSRGVCALGFGVCCVYTVTCDQDVYNNITYFVNPNFPDLSGTMDSCSLKVKKIDPEIAQLRLDFIHFNLGQPNRQTGVCEEDSFVVADGGAMKLTLCGINSGQHAYFDVENVNEAIMVSMNLSKRAVGRLWEVKITQVPFTQRAPAGCLQYYTGDAGVIQTMNFADNGRHLANQDYNICMRQEDGMCSIVYEPCYNNSFKIGSRPQTSQVTLNMNDQAGSETNDAQNGELQDVGSGDGADVAVVENRMDNNVCSDRISLPCDSEDLLMPTDSASGFCTLAHCGNSLCDFRESPCRLESSVTPFTVGVHFGESAREENPEDNLGMCLTYQQMPCLV